MQCYAHTIQNAHKTGLILAGADEYGVPQWIGNHKQWADFNLLEINHELL